MAIIFDAVSDAGSTGTGTDITWSHTCTGSNLVLVVCVMIAHSAITTQSVTYNGVTMTAQAEYDVNGLSQSSEIWFLNAPPTGTNTIEVKLQGGTPGGSAMGAVSFRGTDQTPTVINAHTGSEGTIQNISDTITSTIDGCYVVDCVSWNDGSHALTPGASQTQIFSDMTSNGDLGVGYYKPAPTHGQQTMSYTSNMSIVYTHSLVVIAPFPVSSGIHLLPLINAGT